jgi:hypothetical protein
MSKVSLELWGLLYNGRPYGVYCLVAKDFHFSGSVSAVQDRALFGGTSKLCNECHIKDCVATVLWRAVDIS